jgi:hypothetical protein
MRGEIDVSVLDGRPRRRDRLHLPAELVADAQSFHGPHALDA